MQDRDGTNTSIPTSHTPIGKPKVIPNGKKDADQEKEG